MNAVKLKLPSIVKIHLVVNVSKIRCYIGQVDVRATRVEHSRRFLRELDKAPKGNNLHYICYSVLTSLHLATRVQTIKVHQKATECTQNNGGMTKYYIVIFNQLWDHSRGQIRALELYVRGPLTFTPLQGCCASKQQFWT